MPRRLPPPWISRELEESFAVDDAKEQNLAYVYFDRDPFHQSVTKRLTQDEARRVAANIAKIPGMVQLLEARAEKLAGCTEGSEEEAELAAIADVLRPMEGA